MEDKLVRRRGGPLEGTLVVDLTTVMMGPFATQMLAEMGAEVIKVEPPGGDPLRGVGPGRPPAAGEQRMGPVFMNANRGKRSIVLDVKSPADRDMLLRLVDRADVFVSNIRPQALARLGLTASSLHARNPGLILAGAHGFGTNGPYAGLPAFDDVIQALSGVPGLAHRAGADRPRYAPITLADRVTGYAVAVAILAALLGRGRDGRGCEVEVPMFETMAHMVLGDHLGGQSYDPPSGGFGYQRLLSPLRRPFRTLDGVICVIVWTDAHWRTFLGLIGKAGLWETDARFATLSTRTVHTDALYSIVEEALATRRTDEWLSILQGADVPAARVHTPETLLEDPHLDAAGFFQWEEHEMQGRTRSLRSPLRWVDRARAEPSGAPALDEHGAEIRAALMPRMAEAVCP